MAPTRKVKGTTARALRQVQHLPAPEVQSPANNPGTASSGEDSSLLEPDDRDLGIELEKMLQSFQEDLEKLFIKKRKCIEMQVNASINTIQQIIDHGLTTQHERSQKLCKDFLDQLKILIQLLDQDVKKVYEQGEKLAKIFLQQRKAFFLSLSVHNRKKRAFEKLYGQYMQSLEDLEEHHKGVLTSELNALRKEMDALGEKLIMEARKEMTGALKYLLGLSFL
ncbi:synaptonemal complex protein 3-like [Castor canadensis]|uniref:Synaptonemal complex protein 3-like n=1 Tax=Castor canadensis TaxID=51338 RepID=A0AC58LN41_CASCN